MESLCSTLHLGEKTIHDLHLHPAGAPTASSNPQPLELTLLALVDPSRIPLYLACGPSYHVYSGSEETEEWLSDTLFSTPIASDGSCSETWWTTGTRQSAVGVLVRIVPTPENQKVLRKATELLFYGVMEGLDGNYPIPSSDTATGDASTAQHEPVFRVRALPLCSDIHALINTPLSPPLSPALPATEDGAQFLPSFQEMKATALATQNKRKYVADMFDAATERRKKAKREGGQSVSAAAARLDPIRPVTSYMSQPNSPLEETQAESGARERDPRRHVARSRSVSENLLGRKGLLDGPVKRSPLSRVQTSAALVSEDITEAKNKETLSRLVMAGMRFYGLTQRKKRTSRHPSMASIDLAGMDKPLAEEDGDKDEEYKLVYHQAYKTSAFAFRKHIATTLLQPSQLQATIDRILSLLCTDPLASPLIPSE
ncbi:hypothetical protein EJ06DRAFT_169063 [Trichodelitschia bisporula]|uniref:Sld7 C-terminal domain-containing protein n=1 Tax=Trichodelitschia bisporula TaxID=703511 RepID=A0A6G1HMH9_9PEZI|nr:hypothetical protein EJ06DRAFT_169063 [Trichodelitschia bisporula]